MESTNNQDIVQQNIQESVEKKRKNKKNQKKKSFGLIDSIINRMPEIHIYSYQYAGPGTKLEKRLARGDPGKNELDVACRDHDIAYASCEDSKSRRKADKVLIKRAFKRVYSKDAKLDERAVALLVSGLMSAKVGLTKIGLGLGDKRAHKKMKRSGKRHRKSVAFSKLVRGARESIKQSKLKSISSDDAIKAAIRSAKDMKRGKTVKLPRVLKLPKIGGNLQSILPVLSALSSIGSITASTAGVVKSIKDIQLAKKQLMEQNISGEKKIGRGLDLLYQPDKSVKGLGFYLKPYQHQRN